MTKRILKHHLALTGGEAQPLALRQGARVVHVGNQHERVTLWFEADDDAETEGRLFYVVGTGHDIPSNCDYRGTALLLGGQFVWHVYEARPAQAELVPELR